MCLYQLTPHEGPFPEEVIAWKVFFKPEADKPLEKNLYSLFFGLTFAHHAESGGYPESTWITDVNDEFITTVPGDYRIGFHAFTNRPHAFKYLIGERKEIVRRVALRDITCYGKTQLPSSRKEDQRVYLDSVVARRMFIYPEE
jgi:hypothetical protein